MVVHLWITFAATDDSPLSHSWITDGRHPWNINGSHSWMSGRLATGGPSMQHRWLSTYDAPFKGGYPTLRVVRWLSTYESPSRPPMILPSAIHESPMAATHETSMAATHEWADGWPRVVHRCSTDVMHHLKVAIQRYPMVVHLWITFAATDDSPLSHSWITDGRHPWNINGSHSWMSGRLATGGPSMQHRWDAPFKGGYPTLADGCPPMNHLRGHRWFSPQPFMNHRWPPPMKHQWQPLMNERTAGHGWFIDAAPMGCTI